MRISFAFGSAGTPAILPGGLMVWGLNPGPLLFVEHWDFVQGLIASIHRGNVVGLSRETSRSRSAVKTECAEQSGRRLPIRCADWFPYALVVDPVVDPELRLNARGGNSRHHVGLVDQSPEYLKAPLILRIESDRALV